MKENNVANHQDELRPWKCKNHHVLGQVRRNGSGIRQLLLYREAIDVTVGGEMAEVQVMAVVEGLVLDVSCSICGCPRTWTPGEEALARLVEQVRRLRAVSTNVG
jgi:hypothetical protein